MTMTRKPARCRTRPTVAGCRATIRRLEADLEILAAVSPPERALKLGRACDLLIEARAVNLYRLK
jgi:hypothetical protein